MQIIQTIRDKGAVYIVIILSIALVVFLIQMATDGSMGGSMSNTVGSVNGKEITLDDIEKKKEVFEELLSQQLGQNPLISTVSRDLAWYELLKENTLTDAQSNMGISTSEKEVSFICSIDDINNPFYNAPGFKDSTTQQFNPELVKQYIASVKNEKDKEQRQLKFKQSGLEVLDQIPTALNERKYSSLLTASAYYPSWLSSADIAESNRFSTVSYVYVPYTDIADSTIKASNKEIEDYVKENPLLFQQEEGRKIAYVSFKMVASASDSNAIKSELTSIIPAFQADSNTSVFVASNQSDIPYEDVFVPKNKQLSPAVADSLLTKPKNTVFGPYIDRDRGAYFIAKLIDSKSMPDSVQAKHILISTQGQDQQVARTEDEAKKLADSLKTEIDKGASFAELAAKFSADGSKDKGGDLGTFAYDAMVSEFRDYCFNNTAGSRGVVKTQFGYHIIEIVSQKGVGPALKMAYINRSFIPSAETLESINAAAVNAASFKDKASLEKHLAKSGLVLTSPATLSENDYLVGNLQNARELVKWAFKASPGQITEDPITIGDEKVVAVMEKEYKKGLQDAETARPNCERFIINKKKEEIIRKKIGNATTLEAMATAYGKQIQNITDSTLTLSAGFFPGVGQFPKAIGAAFNPAYQGKPSALFADKENGVMMLKINSILPLRSTPTPEEEVAFRKQKTANAKSMFNVRVLPDENYYLRGNKLPSSILLGIPKFNWPGWIESMVFNASVTDNRSEFY
jgi:peptidyl-prolyl cis-trans isomerase D